MRRQCNRPCKTRRHSTNIKPGKPNRKGLRMSKKQDRANKRHYRALRKQERSRVARAHLLDLQDKARELERERMATLFSRVAALLPLRYWPA